MKKQPPFTEQTNVTENVLRLVRNQNHSPPHSAHDSEEEEKVEVDERWLIAYADKMTLLCGLFVMLFAMSTLDKTKFQKVKDSTEKSFGKPTTDKAKEFIDPQLLKESKAHENTLREKVNELTQKTQQLQEKLIQKEEAIKNFTSHKTKIEELTKLVESQKRQLAEAQKKVAVVIPPPPVPDRIPVPVPAKPSFEAEVKSLQQKVEKQQTQLNTLKVTEADLTKTLEHSNQERAQLVGEVGVLKEEIERLKATQQTSTFMSVVMSWPTMDHDVDLSIQDPQGKTFDFKHRKYNEHPGVFVLDTRRGPGNEVWQAEKIIPGTYKIKYSFYNQYGNKAPCPVSGTFVTPKGNFDLPKVNLTMDGKREATFLVDIDRIGNVVIR